MTVINDQLYCINSNIVQLLFDVEIKKNKKVLICDIDIFGNRIIDLVKNNIDIDFYYTIRHKIDDNKINDELKYKNCHFLDGDTYDYNFTDLKFDYIFSIPIFGMKLDNLEDGYVSRDSSMVTCQNLLYHLNSEGKLRIIMPAKVTFGSGESERFREYIVTNYKINEISSLPSGAFNPQTAIKTFLFDFSIGMTEEVKITKYEFDKDDKKNKSDFKPINISDKLLLKNEFNNMGSWNVDTVFVEKNDEMLRYDNSKYPKVLIKDIAYLFRGKYVKDKLPDGNISVINISNIEENEIDYSNLERFKDDEIKNLKYILSDGDVLVAARGTMVKIAVFEKQDFICIASSNLNVIRIKDKINSCYLKIFLESKVGTEIIKSLQRGYGILNINFQDLGMIAVPVPDMKFQNEIVEKYNNEFKKYKEALYNWSKIRNEIYYNMF